MVNHAQAESIFECYFSTFPFETHIITRKAFVFDAMMIAKLALCVAKMICKGSHVPLSNMVDRLMWGDTSDIAE